MGRMGRGGAQFSAMDILRAEPRARDHLHLVPDPDSLAKILSRLLYL
jgi:hypothetical protein